jgi:hypothetical protein
MDGGVEEPLASTLGGLAVAGILWDVGDHARIENALPIRSGVKTAVEIDIGPSEVQTDLFSYLLQGKASANPYPLQKKRHFPKKTAIT